MLSDDLLKIIAREEVPTPVSTHTFSGIDTLIAELEFNARHLVVLVNGQASSGTPDILVRFNSDTGANYNYQNLKGASSTASASRSSAQTSVKIGSLPSTSNVFGGGSLLIPAAFLTDTFKSFESLLGEAENNVELIAGHWADKSAITSVTVFPSASTFAAETLLELAVLDEMFAIPGAETILT